MQLLHGPDGISTTGEKDNLLQSSVVYRFAIKDVQRPCCGNTLLSNLRMFIYRP